MLDAHAHVSFKKFNRDRAQVLERCRLAGVGVVDCAVTLSTLERSLELSSSYGFVYSSAGVHPYKVGRLSGVQLHELLRSIEESVEQLVAIGEAGLDYYLDAGSAELQREVFKSVATLAKEHALPLVVHARGAEEEALHLLLELEVERALFHCYGGDRSTALKILESGYYISLATNLCFSEHHAKLARELPVEKILLETDSPYLSPFRGRRNEPVFVLEAVRRLAGIKGVSERKIAEAVERNARRFYGI
ncbi:TatD family hydrolase [Candidatus Pyrohabitans sp.]